VAHPDPVEVGNTDSGLFPEDLSEAKRLQQAHESEMLRRYAKPLGAFPATDSLAS
jgi:hypothetical protein